MILGRVIIENKKEGSRHRDASPDQNEDNRALAGIQSRDVRKEFKSQATCRVKTGSLGSLASFPLM